jgi:hypothetical protein
VLEQPASSRQPSRKAEMKTFEEVRFSKENLCVIPGQKYMFLRDQAERVLRILKTTANHSDDVCGAGV